jgi:type II secretory pathway pseudopilin PulG
MGGKYFKNNKGFTLTEAIVIVAVVSIFLSALLPFIVENLTINPRSKKRLVAYEAAYAKVEDLRHQNFIDLANASFAVPEISGASGQVTISGIDIDEDGYDESDIVKAKVDVSYPEKGETKTMTLNTLIADGGIINN